MTHRIGANHAQDASTHDLDLPEVFWPHTPNPEPTTIAMREARRDRAIGYNACLEATRAAELYQVLRDLLQGASNDWRDVVRVNSDYEKDPSGEYLLSPQDILERRAWKLLKTLEDQP